MHHKKEKVLYAIWAEEIVALPPKSVVVVTVAPEPITEWDSILDATKEAPQCYQRHMIRFNEIDGSEDCLYLNVYMPQKTKHFGKLPVMIWIHGGSFVCGSSREELCGPEFLMSKKIVLVTFNYRIGLLGFISFKDPLAKVPGNAGLKDQVLVLKWVQDNIEQFNGNKDNVTLFGQGAGAACVHLHMLSPLSRGLFHKAVMQSGCALNPWANGLLGTGRLAGKFLDIKGTDCEVLNALRLLPVEQIFTLQETLANDNRVDVLWLCSPVVEDKKDLESFLPDEPINIIRSKRYAVVPMIIGYTSREGSYWDISNQQMSGKSKIITNFRTVTPNNINCKKGGLLSNTIAKRISDFYYGPRLTQTRMGRYPRLKQMDPLYQIMTDVFFLNGIFATINNHLELFPKIPVYYYKFNYQTTLNIFKQMTCLVHQRKYTGAVHGDDLGYLWCTYLTPQLWCEDEENEAIETVVSLWTSFAKTGKPRLKKSGKACFNWIPTTKASFHCLNISKHLKIEYNPDMDRVLMWQKIYKNDVRTKTIWILSKVLSNFSTSQTSTMAEPIVKIKYGKLRGTIGVDYDGNKYYRFQGIPFAKPPIGALRFKAPEPPNSWEGVRDATKNGNQPLCVDSLFPSECQSEDCLFLNVYTPELPRSNTVFKPVMVWIYGGAFITGGSSSSLYGPEFLITKEVVIVTFNYRGGLFGFLNFEDPTLDIPGNAGFKDQVMALRWIQENIREFGGDSNNVTIFGESAGSASVQCMILSPLAKGLFHKAILQSGSIFGNWARTKRTLPFLTKQLSINTTNEKEILDRLSKMNSNEILELQSKIPDDCQAFFKRCFGLVIEHAKAPSAFLTREPIEIILSGDYNRVPIIIGFTSFEGMVADFFGANVSDTYTIDDFEKMIPYELNIDSGSKLSKIIANKIKKFYYGPYNCSEEHKRQYYLVQGDYLVTWPTLFSTRLFASTTDKPVYLYRISIESTLSIYKKMRKNNCPGVCHGDDLGYFFKSVMAPSIIPGSVEDLTIRRCVTLWSNFAKYGNPNPLQLDSLINVYWKPVCNTTLNFLEIGDNLTTGINPEENRMKFWDEIYSLIYKVS
ncbi:hypothetical protein FQA39_LY07611 [Lamprigera yunnana]|nr:hypothetical protein FQA39_LY07611 [Lamprigera yunnana]